MEINYAEIRQSFMNTSIDMLDRCESDLISAEELPVLPDFTEFLRSIHTIKGNAGIFELSGLINLCHSVETLFVRITARAQKLDQATTDELLMALDLMKELVRNSEKGESPEATQKIAATLVRIEKLEGSSGANSTVQTPATAAAPQKSAPGSFRLPQKYFDYARKNEKDLHFVMIDLSEQKELTLSQLHACLTELHDQKDLLSFGDLSDKLKTKQPGLVPYYLVIARNGDIGKYLAARGIQPLVCRNLYTHAAPPAPENPAVESVPVAAVETHLKVKSDLLTSLIDVTGEIVLTRNTLLRRIDALKESSLQLAGKKLSHLVSDLQDLVMRTRLQPIKVLLQRLPRLARDTALATGKKVNLQMKDGGIEIDKVIYDQIDESLTHLIRNAVDHGIETPAERAALGKNETGQIELSVSMQAGSILIAIQDDGRGLNFDAIKQKAAEKNLLTQNADTMDRQEIANLIFLPGFSTRKEISTVSGRGVGMDVVRSCITRVGGAVDIDFDRAYGTQFVLRIPQTLSILTCLIIDVAGKRLAIPRQHIAELIVHDEAKMRRTPKSEMVLLRDELIPVIDAAQMLGLGVIDPSHQLIVRTERHRFALTVNGVMDTEEVVVKPVPVKIKTEQYFSGAAVMGDGEIALILDIHAIVRHNRLEADQAVLAAAENKGTKMLVAQNDTTCLLIEVLNRQILVHMSESPRIEKIAGERIEIYNGRASFIYENESVEILPWKNITGHELSQILESGNDEFYLILFRSEKGKFALIATSLFDIVSRFENAVTESAGHPAITGETVIRGRSALVVNALRIFESQILNGVNHG